MPCIAWAGLKPPYNICVHFAGTILEICPAPNIIKAGGWVLYEKMEIAKAIN